MKFLLHIAILLTCTFSQGQELSESLSSKTIQIGDPNTITYKIKANKGDSIVFEADNYPKASLKNSGSSLSGDPIDLEETTPYFDTLLINGNSITWIGKYSVTAFDSGSVVIAGPSVIVNDSTFYFNDLNFDVTLVPAIDSIDIYDINESFADIPNEPFSLKKILGKNWWWILLIVAALLIAIWLKLRKKDKKFVEPENRTSLKRRTLIAIEALEDAKLWEKDQLKEHFVELSYILRAYLTARYSMSLLESTTLQTNKLLKEKGLNDDTIMIINRILSVADLVKFARSTPDMLAILKTSTLAKQVVAETSPLEIDEDAE